ncbi:MAG TPA: ThuA domain-containing protein [Pirellulales bacterium]|nr:ThuA domain-containing protein [Pirellulales bacterium]
MRTILICSLITLTGWLEAEPAAAPQWVVFEGTEGPGRGKHVVLISGDEEYRSEEGLPQLGKMLARHHGFKCTVLFAINPSDGTIDPTNRENIPGLESLATADLMIIATRFRDLPDEQMKHIDDYLRSGRPVIGMRTATHAFSIKPDKPYARYSYNSRVWEGGFGRQVLGETWVSHHGAHGKQSTRGIIAPAAKDDPIVRGIADGDIWGTTDVYGVRLPLPGDSKPLVLGQVLEGMEPSDRAVPGEKNDPMMPVAWKKTYQIPEGKTGRAFATTMGAATDLLSAGFRRLLINASYWAVGLEDQIPEHANVDLVGDYEPLPFGFKKFREGLRPSDYAGW